MHILISHCPETLRLSRPEMSALHLAARNGHSVVVLSLINAGIPVNTMVIIIIMMMIICHYFLV